MTKGAINSAEGERALWRHVRGRTLNLSLTTLASLRQALPDADPSRTDSLDDTEVGKMIEALRNENRPVIAHAVECHILMPAFPGNPNSVVFSLLPPGFGPNAARNYLQQVWSRAGTGQMEDKTLNSLCQSMLKVLGADDFNSQVYTQHSALLSRISRDVSTAGELAAIDWRQSGESLEDGSPVTLISMYRDLCSRVHQGAFVDIRVSELHQSPLIPCV